MERPETYIWPSRWADFQHYKPERDRPPAWIKAYTKQLDDAAYLDLSSHLRAMLHDLRMLFARAHDKLPTNPRRLSNALGYRVVTADLERLSDAGFLEFISRDTLEQRLELLYASRARPRAREEGEEELEGPLTPRSGDNDTEPPPTTPRATGTNPRAQGTNPRAIAQREREQRHADLLARAHALAADWNGSDSAALDTKLDWLEVQTGARLTALEREGMWDEAFGGF